MATTSTTRKSSKKHSFKWTPEMVENLIESIKSFKASMTFKNLDFDANKAAQYSAVRERDLNTKRIVKRKSRIQEKTKEIGQSFSKAVVSVGLTQWKW